MTQDSEKEAFQADGEQAPTTDPQIKTALQELIRFGYIDESRKSQIFSYAVLHEAQLDQFLEPLDLALRLDTHRGLALLVIRSQPQEENSDGWSHPLVKRHRLTLEQSLVMALLREAFLIHEQERGVGQEPARLAVDDLLPKFLTFLPDAMSDNLNESRLSSVLDQLKAHGIVSEVDRNNEFFIRPLIVHLANAESLALLLQHFESLAKGSE